MFGLSAIVSGFAWNCKFCRVLISTCDHFGNRFYRTIRVASQSVVYFVYKSLKDFYLH